MSIQQTAGLLLFLGGFAVLVRHLLKPQQSPPRDVWAEHDEAWQLFKSPEFRDRLEEYTRSVDAYVIAAVEAVELDDDDAVAAWLDGAR